MRVVVLGSTRLSAATEQSLINKLGAKKTEFKKRRRALELKLEEIDALIEESDRIAAGVAMSIDRSNRLCVGCYRVVKHELEHSGDDGDYACCQAKV
jgi:hypothetical protein